MRGLFYSRRAVWQGAIARKVRFGYTQRMPKRRTTDHGEIIHFAGRHRLFPVARKDDAAQVRLATREDVRAEEVRVGWPIYFRPFIDRRLVFLYDEAGPSGQAVTRAEADAEQAQGPAGPAGAASTA
jgi:hypothetical protein